MVLAALLFLARCCPSNRDCSDGVKLVKARALTLVVLVFEPHVGALRAAQSGRTLASVETRSHRRCADAVFVLLCALHAG